MATRSCCGTGSSSPRIPSSFEQKFPAWKNFPAGLHALLLSQDPTSLADAKLKLQSCDYAVTALSDREEARKALQHHPVEAAFHLAIVEIDPTNASESLAIVAAAVAKHLPTILLSSTENVDMMVKGIEAGASEFIEKPLTANKLKNIWQHVFRKALITGELIVPQHLHSPCEHTSLNDGDGTVLAQQQAIINEMKSSQKPDEIALFSAEEIIGEECGRQARLNQQRPDLDLDSAPSTPQLIQATRADISLDASHHSDDCACAKSEGEDDLSTDDNCSFSHIPNDGDEMDGACLFKESHCDGYDFHDLESLEAALCEDVVNDMQYQGLEFQDHLADDLVDELLCIDMHSGMLDNILGDRDMGLSSANADDDEAEQNDEEALLLAEVAKAEAGMSSSTSSSCSMSSSSSSSSFVCDFKPVHKGSNAAHEDESCMKEWVSATDDAELSSRSRNRNKKGGSKKKMKVDWTPELHRRFVRAAEQLGVDKAIPSKILEMMGVQNLTRHNVASHLQKYRSHKKHLQRAESAPQRSAPPKAQAQQTHVIPRPAPIVPIGLHVWGHPSPDHFCWPKPWQAPDGTYWHPSRPVGIDTWGHPASGAALVYPRPVLQRLPLAPVPGAANRMIAIDKTPGLHPPKERVDAAIREVLKNPFTPLPLGLKSPSMESVMMELQKKGIKPVPINAKQAV